ncbi:hypothetical protein ACIQ57_23655 [Lysinibacillus xylanilyticus]|uniref:hypothetical protein n=1 Tax=Lysinibacillus xylanilyticus TaxID=582475 RepID=UPI0038162882
MNSNNKRCHQVGCTCQRCSNGKFNCTGLRPFRAIDAACIPPIIPDPPKEEALVAYGSFYNPTGHNESVAPIPPPPLGPKVIFTTPGPSLNVDPAPVPNNTTDLQVAINGVYEISMDITVDLFSLSNSSVNAAVHFGLFINDSTLATGSNFESINIINITPGDQIAGSIMNNTIGKTIILRLNKGDRLSIRVISASGSVFYRFPSFVVNKIAD